MEALSTEGSVLTAHRSEGGSPYFGLKKKEKGFFKIRDFGISGFRDFGIWERKNQKWIKTSHQKVFLPFLHKIWSTDQRLHNCHSFIRFAVCPASI